jgi:L-proline amide hydrolase
MSVSPSAPSSGPPHEEGTVAFREWKTWYRVTGQLDAGRTPLIALHGGPGSIHDYLLPLADMVGGTWPVIHYDQLGNGRSTHLPDQPSDFWNVQLFLDELDNLLAQLGVAQDYFLFGQSWGGMLAAEHAVRRPAGLRGLVIANSPASMPLWREELARLRETLPRVVQVRLNRHEEAGTTDSSEYYAASMVFYRRHVCRLNPLPDEVAATLEGINNDPTVYHAMNGPTEFHIIGSLRDWTIVDRLPSISVPTLVVAGRHDEVTEAAARPFSDYIPGAHWECFDSSSHMPHVEEPEKFSKVLNEFLASLT